jgi:hypothetical protein
MTYTQFKNKWLGKRVDYDHVYSYQCVDLIKQYLSERFGIKAGSWGNAIDYWYHTNAAILKKFDKLSTSKARQGDIVIFKGINGNPYGHIGVCDANVGTLSVNVNTLEQNGSTGNGSGTGGDAIRVRGIPRWRVVGVLRPKTAKPASKMPPVGSKIQITKGTVRTTYKAKTTKVAGHIKAVDNTYIYVVRGYDPVYGNRILINSASAGGNGVALALYYTNGTIIAGWKRV